MELTPSNQPEKKKTPKRRDLYEQNARKSAIDGYPSISSQLSGESHRQGMEPRNPIMEPMPEGTVKFEKRSLEETIKFTKGNFDKACQDLDKYLDSHKDEIREIDKFTSYYKDVTSCLKEDFILRWRAERLLEREDTAGEI